LFETPEGTMVGRKVFGTGVGALGLFAMEDILEGGFSEVGTAIAGAVAGTGGVAALGLFAMEDILEGGFSEIGNAIVGADTDGVRGSTLGKEAGPWTGIVGATGLSLGALAAVVGLCLRTVGATGMR
jgi:hypothetical protein